MLSREERRLLGKSLCQSRVPRVAGLMAVAPDGRPHSLILLIALL